MSSLSPLTDTVPVTPYPTEHESFASANVPVLAAVPGSLIHDFFPDPVLDSTHYRPELGLTQTHGYFGHVPHQVRNMVAILRRRSGNIYQA